MSDHQQVAFSNNPALWPRAVHEISASGAGQMVIVAHCKLQLPEQKPGGHAAGFHSPYN